MLDTLNEYLVVLNNLIATNPKYRALYNYTLKVKETSGTSFSVYTETGIPNMAIKLDSFVLPVSLKRNKYIVPSDSVVEVNLLATLEQLTCDFSALSGMTNKDWLTLVVYLYNSFDRSKNPQTANYNGPLDDEEGNEEIIKVLLNYPWTIVILLMELLCVLRPVY